MAQLTLSTRTIPNAVRVSEVELLATDERVLDFFRRELAESSAIPANSKVTSISFRKEYNYFIVDAEIIELQSEEEMILDAMNKLDTPWPRK